VEFLLAADLHPAPRLNPYPPLQYSTVVTPLALTLPGLPDLPAYGTETETETGLPFSLFSTSSVPSRYLDASLQPVRNSTPRF